jgi:hypothetical protein
MSSTSRSAISSRFLSMSLAAVGQCHFHDSLALERMDPALDAAPKRRLLSRERERHECYSVILSLDAEKYVLPTRLFRLSDRVPNIGG